MKALAGIMSLVVLLGAACAAELNTPEQLYQKALHLETAKADYQGAIPIYATIISNHEQNAAFTIKALYRQGVCYEKIGQSEKAAECARQLARDYASFVKQNTEMELFVEKYRSSESGDDHARQNVGFPQKIEGVWWDGDFLPLSYRGAIKVVETPIRLLVRSGPCGLAFHPDGRIAFSEGQGCNENMLIAYGSANGNFDPVVDIKYVNIKDGQNPSAALENQGFFWSFNGPLAFNADGTCYFSLGSCNPNGIYKITSSKPVKIEKLHSIESASSLQVPVFDKSCLYSTSWNGIFRYALTAAPASTKSNLWFSISGDGILMSHSLIISSTRVVVDALIFKSSTEKRDYDMVTLIFDKEQKAYWSLLADRSRPTAGFGPMAISWDGKQMIHFNSKANTINGFSLEGIIQPVAACGQ